MVHLISLGCNFRTKLKIGHFSTLGGNKIIDSKRLSVTGQQSFSQLNRIMPGFTLSSVIFCQQFFVKVESPWTKMLCQAMWSPMHTCSSADLNWPTLVGLHSQHELFSILFHFFQHSMCRLWWLHCAPMPLNLSPPWFLPPRRRRRTFPWHLLR